MIKHIMPKFDKPVGLFNLPTLFGFSAREQGYRLKNVTIIGLVTHPPHNNFTSWLVVDVFDSNAWLAEKN